MFADLSHWAQASQLIASAVTNTNKKSIVLFICFGFFSFWSIRIAATANNKNKGNNHYG
jgi:hypothetical protein